MKIKHNKPAYALAEGNVGTTGWSRSFPSENTKISTFFGIFVKQRYSDKTVKLALDIPQSLDETGKPRAKNNFEKKQTETTIWKLFGIVVKTKVSTTHWLSDYLEW